MSTVQLRDICVSYDGKTNILQKLNIDIEEGALISLLGPSGCGKTTTLRVIAGFITPSSGSFYCDQEELTKVPVHKRNFGLVFQSYALFPHLSVFDNVAFGLKERKVAKASLERSVKEMLDICDLGELAKRFPKQLSGGQRQRVALARALVIEPRLLLLDEPLSNLDAKLRLTMRMEIKKLQKKLGITTIFVTHDQEECFSISDKVAVMNQGVIEQYDTPEEIYAHPKTEFVARFIGFENFIAFHQKDGVFQAIEVPFITSEASHERTNVLGTIRPEDIHIVETKNEGNFLEGQIQVRTFLGKSYQYEVMTEVGRLLVNDGQARRYQTGDSVLLYLPAQKIILV